LWKEGRPALTLYSLDCGLDPGSLTWTWRAEPEKVVEALARSQLRAPGVLRSVEVVQRNAAGRALTLALVGSETVRINAESFRLAVGRELGWNTLRSDLYEARGLVFQGRGAGHGMGLCQRGADQMGVEGRGYREILAVSYPGTVLGVTARGISWQRLCGSAVCLMTTNPQLDREVLATAERLASRGPWPVSGVEVRMYPDVDTFRDATGEPGWVAAHTSGKRVHVQPAAKLGSALEKTLRHELLHVAIEAEARTELPVWFHEGLALYLEGGVRGTAAIPNDADLRRTGDAAAVRRAYGQAGRAVAGLVARYGETTVLGWVRRRLPPEVRNASSSPAATKSK
jgi:stage II sporulation protein D